MLDEAFPDCHDVAMKSDAGNLEQSFFRCEQSNEKCGFFREMKNFAHSKKRDSSFLCFNENIYIIIISPPRHKIQNGCLE